MNSKISEGHVDSSFNTITVWFDVDSTVLCRFPNLRFGEKVEAEAAEEKRTERGPG